MPPPYLVGLCANPECRKAIVILEGETPPECGQCGGVEYEVWREPQGAQTDWGPPDGRVLVHASELPHPDPTGIEELPDDDANGIPV